MRGDHAALVHDGQVRQVVALADLEVVRVVRRGHLDRAGAERRVDVLVGDDRDAAAGQRQLDLGADQVPVALVVGVHGDRGVAEHRLGPGGGDHDRVVAVAVADRDELALVVGVLDLDVGQRGQAARAPVDDPLGPVDQAVVEQPLEDGEDGPGQALVHGEALAAPVDASRRAAASGRGSRRRTRPSTARPARRTSPGPGRGGTGPPSASCRSTTFWVAMPAWSMPGSHSAS